MAEAMDLKSIQCGFDSHSAYHGPVAQWLEHPSYKRKVVSSILTRATIHIMNFKKYLIVFCLSVLADFVASCYSYLIAHEWVISQMFLGFSLPFINFLSVKYFIDNKDIKERLKITFCCASGMAIGSTVMLLLLKDIVN